VSGRSRLRSSTPSVQPLRTSTFDVSDWPVLTNAQSFPSII